MDIQKNEKRHRSRGHDEPPRKKPVREGTAEGKTEDRNDSCTAGFE